MDCKGALCGKPVRGGGGRVKEELAKIRVTFVPEDNRVMVVIGKEESLFVMSIGVLRKVVELHDELYGEDEE